jgi:hypothetical protein
MSGGDMGRVRELLGEMNKEQQKLGVEQKKGVDPITDIAQTTMEINETLRGMSKGFIRGLVDLMGPLGLMAAFMAPMAGSLWSIAGGLGGAGGIKGMIGGLFGKGGGDGEERGGILSRIGGFLKKDKDKREPATRAADTAGGAAQCELPSFPKIPEFDAGKMGKQGKNLLKWAAAMAIIVIGVVALGAVLIKAAQLLLGGLGITPQVAMEVGLTVAIILGAAALIAAAALGAAKGLEKLGEMKKLPVGEIYKGALTLLILIPAMLLLAGAILAMGALVAMFVSPGKVKEIVEAVTALLVGAALIAGAVLLGAVATAALGALVMLAWGPQGLLILQALGAGAAALLLLTPAMLLMAGAIIGIAKGITNIVDPAESAKTAENVATIMKAAGSIAASVLVSAAALTALGVMSLLGPVLAVAMLLGARALVLLTGGILALSLVIIKMGSAIAGMVDPKELKKTNETLELVFDSVWMITKNVLFYAPMLTALGALSLTAGLIAGLMMLGVAAFHIMALPIILFMKSVIDIGRAISQFVDPEEAKVIKTAIMNISQIAKSLGEVTDVFVESIVPFVTPGWFTASPASKLREAMPMFEDLFSEMGVFLKFGIIEPLKGYFPDEAEVSDTIPKIRGMAKILSNLKPIMDFMTEVVLKWTDKGFWTGSSIAGDLQQMMPTFSALFWNMGAFLYDGIIRKDNALPEEFVNSDARIGWRWWMVLVITHRRTCMAYHGICQLL